MADRERRAPAAARAAVVPADRRRFIARVAAAGISAVASRGIGAAGAIVDDVSRLNPVAVADARAPRSTDEVRACLRESRAPVSVGGGRYSMGGQVSSPDSMHVDMRQMRRVVAFDPAARTLRVQAGITWRDIQDVIDPHDLSVRIMQSYSNFTVGGSVSVNCHGRYVGRGPLVNSVRALQLVGADGEVYELSRGREPGLFAAVCGGYGGVGVITEVELDLDLNGRIERVVRDVALDAYPQHFREQVLGDARVVLHNADLAPPRFDAPRAVSWIATDRAVTEPARLVPRGLDYTLERNALWALTELPGGSRLREKVIDPARYRRPAVVWRNHEASLDAASLEPRTRRLSTYLLQEYFIPVAGFAPFARELARVLVARRVEALYVSIRHSPADGVSLLRWAPVEVFSFVLYYKQRRGTTAEAAAAAWTQELVEAALAAGGRYYLPYRLHATRRQFERAYPEADAFRRLRAELDPRGRFRNLMWERYL